MWHKGQFPQDFEDTTIVHLYKKKRNHQLCGSHRGIILLKITEKFFVRFLVNRLKSYLDQGFHPESQCDFCHHRVTTDMIYATGQLQKKCQMMWIYRYSAFVDLAKAFDTVNRKGLWKLMQKADSSE
ncbi:unnamed protein product [Schistocephalus solidus]|uniref:Reverse transcriptase domain-containing protein n=1 Tax=Schistocephalus solidus TaxID=70667 RepID=A0A183T568_SCHSO|nr:unnamed protein product [Schistocephalus solidus]